MPQASAPFRSLFADIVRDGSQIFFAYCKEGLVAFAKIVACLRAQCFIAPVPLTAAPAEGEIRTVPAALLRLRGALQKADLMALLVGLVLPILVDVSQPARIEHIEIAGVDTSVRFHHILNTAYTPLVASLRLKAYQDADVVFELPDEGLLSLLQIGVPQTEKPVQKVPVQLPRLPARRAADGIEALDILLVHPALSLVMGVDLLDVLRHVPCDHTGDIVLDFKGGFHSRSLSYDVLL
ncbi:MAG: hypothetical protein SPL56_09515 [Lachnospiraceae bacterium]|nr:hypothetical protein [Lachnospiraceae bacterium]